MFSFGKPNFDYEETEAYSVGNVLFCFNVVEYLFRDASRIQTSAGLRRHREDLFNIFLKKVLPFLEVGFEACKECEVTSAGVTVNDYSAFDSPLRLSKTSASLRELTIMAVSVTRKIFVIFRKWLLEMVNQRICNVFFGVFCADLLAVDTGNAFCLLSGGLFVISFFAQSKNN